MTQARGQNAVQNSDEAVNELFEGEASIASYSVTSTARQSITGVVAVLVMTAAFIAVVYIVAQLVHLLFPLGVFAAMYGVWQL